MGVRETFQNPFFYGIQFVYAKSNQVMIFVFEQPSERVSGRASKRASERISVCGGREAEASSAERSERCERKNEWPSTVFDFIAHSYPIRRFPIP